MNAGMLDVLWRAVDGHNLTNDQLERLDCTDDLNRSLRNAAEALETLGHLMADDVNVQSGLGNFQDADSVSRALLFFSNVISSAASAYHIAEDAGILLERRKAKRDAEKRGADAD